jgi:glycosyltransferase involved in cell wall biosynthesis
MIQDTAPTDMMVSVVIPTRNRPGLVGRAVHSALNQSFSRIEVIVVIDGPDEKTVQVLGQIGDSRLRVVALEKSVGAQEARNVGVQKAGGFWVAFLDDDDEWLPAKLERQLAIAKASRWSSPIVSCGLIARAPDGDKFYPQREPSDTESVAEYLFLRKHSEMDDIRLQTSTLMLTRNLLWRVPWRKCAADEWDLLLRASLAEGAGLAIVPETLVVWHSDAGDQRLSNTGGTWRNAGQWFQSMRDIVGPRPYASFLLSTLSTWAHRQGDWRALWGLPIEAIRYGSPTFTGILIHTARWLLPTRLRNNLSKFWRAQYSQPGIRRKTSQNESV